MFKAVEAPIQAPSPTQATATNPLATTETVQIPITTTQTPQISAPAVVMATTDVKKKSTKNFLFEISANKFHVHLIETSHCQIDYPFKEK